MSEANKKEANERDAFIRKCAAYLQRWIGVVVIDVVTSRLANLHNQLMQAIGGSGPPLLPTPTPHYVASYRPVHREERNEIDHLAVPRRGWLANPRRTVRASRGSNTCP